MNTALNTPISTSDDTTLMLFAISLMVFAIAIASLATYLFRTSRENKGERRGFSIFFFIVSFITLIPTGICGFLALDTANNEAVAQETALNMQFVQDQNVLSTNSTSYLEQLGIANLQTNRIKTIIVEAIAGQGLVDAKDAKNSPLYKALAEAYPNVTLDQYNQLAVYVQQAQQQFQNAQATLLSELSAFDSWRQSGFLIHPALVLLTGAPNGVLHITLGSKTFTGEAARAQMWKIITDPTTQAAFITSTQEPLPPH